MATTTLRSLDELSRLQPSSLDKDGEKLVRFIVTYQAAHNKQTPAYYTMANELGATEQYVKSVLGRLENQGKIFFTSRNPPSIMIIDPTAVDKPGQSKPGDYDKFLNVEAERHRLARYIGAHEQEHGTGPSLAQMCQFVGIPNRAYVQRMVEVLIERKLVTQEAGAPPHLTAQAREFYRMRRKDDNKPTVVIRPITPGEEKKKMSSTSAVKRMNLLGQALANYKREHGVQFSPTQRELGQLLGYGTGNAPLYGLRDMVEAGLVEPRPKSAKTAVMFTDKGARRFMPELFEEPEVTPTPAPEPTPEPTPEPAPEPAPSIDEVRYEQAAPGAGAIPYEMTLQDYPSGDLIVELINRGYTVRKG